MNDNALKADTQDIVIDEVFPHAPQTIWKALTNGELIGRWLMGPTGFEPVVGRRFTFQTTPAGAWDGVIQCQVLEAIPNERFAYAWKGGHESNVGYGSRLDTVVTFTLSRVAGGTRVRLVHSGFVLPKNDTAFKSMSEGWKKVVRNLDAVAAEQDFSKKQR
ncbi:MAG: SRPBCC domain-containing protein [Stellaceae bacterium]